MPPEKPWAVKGTPETRANLISSIYLETDELEDHQRKMEAKYIRAQEAEPRSELCHTDDAEILLVGYGIVSRVLLSHGRSAAQGRGEGRTVPSDHAVALSHEGVAGSGLEGAKSSGRRIE